MSISVRPTTIEDLAAVQAVLDASYPAVLRQGYGDDFLDRALPFISQAQPDLLVSGRYYLAQDSTSGAVLGVGGWSIDREIPTRGHMRHVATDARALRRGVGRAILAHTLTVARASGMAEMICFATRPAVPFYGALGFVDQGEIGLNLAPDLTFPAVQMRLDLAPAPT